MEPNNSYKCDLTSSLVPLIMLSLNHQNHKQWPKCSHVSYNPPFLVIDDNTIKASINLQKLTNLTTYTCLDAYHHPMSTWPPPIAMIFPFVPPPILLLLPHELTWFTWHFSLFGIYLSSLENTLLWSTSLPLSCYFSLISWLDSLGISPSLEYTSPPWKNTLLWSTSLPL
jgi:hypothetical protein